MFMCGTYISFCVPLVFVYLVLLCFLPLNPGEIQTCGKDAEGNMKPVFLQSNQDFMYPSQVSHGNLVVG